MDLVYNGHHGASILGDISDRWLLFCTGVVALVKRYLAVVHWALLHLFLPSPPAPPSLQHPQLPWPHQAVVHLHPLHHASHQATEHQPLSLWRRETGGGAHCRAAQTLHHICHEVLCPRQVLCQNVIGPSSIFIWNIVINRQPTL